MTEKLPDNENCRIGRVAWKFTDPCKMKKSNQGFTKGDLPWEFCGTKKYRCAEDC